MNPALKIVIPMAGFGTRMRPHTWSKPKQLIQIANSTMLGHVLDMLGTLPAEMPRELIFILGYLGEQVQEYMAREYPGLHVHYVWQREMRGQSHAIYQCKHLLGGPMLMVFADTYVDTDLGFLADEGAEAVAWTKEVPDPRRLGVAVLDPHGWVRGLVEKPATTENKLAVVGCYYFADSLALLAAIEEQMRRDVQLRGEYFLADAVNIMLARGLRMRVQPVGAWLDAGTPEATLGMNRWLLEHGRGNTSEAAQRLGISITGPVWIDPSARVEASVIGPHVTIGAGCRVRGSVIRNSILEAESVVEGAILRDSLVGRRVKVRGVRGIINVGDDAVVTS